MDELRERVKAAIIAEMTRQAASIYWWDDSDAKKFSGEPPDPEWYPPQSGFEDGKMVADNFDMDKVAESAILAIGKAILDT